MTTTHRATDAAHARPTAAPPQRQNVVAAEYPAGELLASAAPQNEVAEPSGGTAPQSSTVRVPAPRLTVTEAPPVLASVRMARLAAFTAADLARVRDNGEVATPPVLTDAALADVLSVVEASTAGATKAAYRSDWARFTTWAGERGHAILPADPLVVASYVTEAAAEMTGVGRWRYAPASLTRWVSSINQFHTAAGLAAPGRSEVVRRALSGIRRIRATPPVRRSPLLLDDLRTLLSTIDQSAGAWPGGVAARRDAALLLMGFAGASRRSELVGLTLGDVTLHRADGLHVRLRSSKTDQEAAGAVKALPFGRDPATCPPCGYVRWRQVLQAWDTAPDNEKRRAVMTVLRRQAAITPARGDDEEEVAVLHVCRSTRLPEPADPERVLFSSVHKTGTISRKPMSGHAVNEMIRRRAGQAGFGPARTRQLGGHSLRAGFVTEAFRAGADAHAIMRQTGHTSSAMLEVYAREHAPLVGNAVTRLGL
ncbi:tyrosine-type recombinase/integrase [Nakamurella sp. GG22]